jgi:predicted  nucleic acid-binding Zn-ribbon protein
MSTIINLKKNTNVSKLHHINDKPDNTVSADQQVNESFEENNYSMPYATTSPKVQGHRQRTKKQQEKQVEGEQTNNPYETRNGRITSIETNANGVPHKMEEIKNNQTVLDSINNSHGNF